MGLGLLQGRYRVGFRAGLGLVQGWFRVGLGLV